MNPFSYQPSFLNSLFCEVFKCVLRSQVLLVGSLIESKIFSHSSNWLFKKYAKNRLDCENNAKNYILANKNLININSKQLKMLSTNFCNGGDEIYEIKNLED